MLLLVVMTDCFRSLRSPHRSVPAVLAVFLCVHSASSNAQAFLEIRAGGQGSSVLVRDSINQVITVKPKAGPSIALAGGSALNDRWILSFSLRWTKSDLMRREAGQEAKLLPLTAWTGMLAVRRSLTEWASVEGSIGGIKYAPGGNPDGTIFQDDSPLVPAIGLAARIERGFGSRWETGVELAYDFHRFTTQALRVIGMGEARSVHRVAVSILLKWRFGSEPR